MSNIPINVLIDGESVLDSGVSFDLDFSGGTANSVTLSFVSRELWQKCDPIDDWGDLRIKICIGEDTYQFLLEERDTNVTETGLEYSVWGRSAHAYLEKPFALNISDASEAEASPHPWRTGNANASTIIDYVIANYAASIPVSWNVLDFIVYEGVLNCDGQFPLDVIKTLADAIGAVVRAMPDGSISVDYFTASGTQQDSVMTYTDLDDLISLSERIEAGVGYNAVTIYGYTSGGPSGTPKSNAPDSDEDDEDEEDPEEEEDETDPDELVKAVVVEWEVEGSASPGTYHNIWVYNPGDLTVSAKYNSAGTNISFTGGPFVETKLEDIVFKNGKGTTDFPIISLENQTKTYQATGPGGSDFTLTLGKIIPAVPDIQIGDDGYKLNKFSREIFVPALEKYDQMLCKVNYTTSRKTYQTFVPNEYDSDQFQVYMTFGDA